MNNISSINLKIVIPTYNRADDLVDCLNSLSNAGISQNQIIIVDNNSQDNTTTIITQEFPEITLIELHENKGATGASNIGFDYALKQQADYVLRLDSDTVVASDFIIPLIKKAEEDSRIGVVAPKIYYFDPPDEIWYAGSFRHPFHFGTTHGHRHEKDNYTNSQVKEVDYAWGAAMLIKSEVLQKTGGFDTDFFVYYEEVDFCLRTQDLGYKIIFVPESHICHKVGSSANNPWTAFHWNRSKMLLYKKHARNNIHFLFLVIYIFSYALIDASLKSLKMREKSGNRGPLKQTLNGLWDGLHERTQNQDSKL